MHQPRNSSELAYAFRLKRGAQPPCPGLQNDVYVGPTAPERQPPEKNTHQDSPVPLVCLRTLRIEIPSHLPSPRFFVPALVGEQLPAASRQTMPRPVSPNDLASDSAVSPRDIFRPAHGRSSRVRTPLPLKPWTLAPPGHEHTRSDHLATTTTDERQGSCASPPQQ
eukprot:15403835-Heterocapsa_arctica.AAC.1